MISRAKKLQEAANKAKQVVSELKEKYPSSKQWDYSLMESDIKETYKALKAAWNDGVDLSEVKEYLSENGYQLLEGKSEWADIKWFDLLECFDFKLEDIVIISVINLPGQSEDKFIVWLNHKKANNNEFDLVSDRADLVENFHWLDNFPSLSGLSFSAFGKKLSRLVGSNDCWTFKWDESRMRWVLDFVVFDRFTDNYLSVLGKSVNYDEVEH